MWERYGKSRPSEFGARRASAWALLLCRRLLGIAGASAKRLRFDRHATNRRLLRLGLAELGTKWSQPWLLGTRRIHFAQLLLKPGVGFCRTRSPAAAAHPDP
jgi:hypothetical protein